ncbi:MAG: long-chain fatty acid--CoA ligase, partial [Proteobacteria bacterium]
MSPAASWVQGDWLAARARLSPERIALEIAKDGRTVTYAAWNETANRTARWLQTQGVGKGDRVAVLSKNRLEILDLWFACGKLGAILQTLNFRLTVHELAQLLDPAPPSLLLYGPDTAQTAEK